MFKAIEYVLVLAIGAAAGAYFATNVSCKTVPALSSTFCVAKTP